MLHHRIAVAAALLILASAAGPRLAAADAKDSRRTFGFGDREIYTFEDDTHRLVVRDLGGDGRDDFSSSTTASESDRVERVKSMVDH